jgi:hypothetical protein
MSLKSEIGKPDYRNVVMVQNGINSDIIKVLESQFPQAVKDAAPIAYRFRGRDRMETAKNIYTALKNDITYQKDREGYQDIRMPRRFWHTGKGDCKSFTINTLAIWSNLYPNDDVRFKYASYGDDKTPTHVYPVVRGGGEEIIIDGCWVFFNSEKTPTFSHKSKNMQVRVLSGPGEDVLQFTPEAKEFYGTIYSSLPMAQRENFKKTLLQKAMLDQTKKAYVEGTIDEHCFYENICAIEGIGRAKHRGRGKKFLHWFNAAALFLGRASFLLFVTLNVNGLASKLAQLIKWGHADRVMDAWYMFGGNVKKFKKIIERGKNKKKLFLSKKAKRRYEERYGPLSPNEVAYEKGVHGTSIGLLPPAAAAALSAVPIIAGLVPKIIAGFREAAPQHPEALKWANGTAGEGRDLVDANQANGYNPSGADLTSAFLPDGENHMTGGARLDPSLHGGRSGGGGGGIVFDMKKFYTPIADDADTPPPDANTDTAAATDTGAIQVPPDAPVPQDSMSNTMDTLGPLLKNLAETGLNTAGAVMAQSKNPKIRQWGGALDGAESVLTGRALHRAGYHDDARYHAQLHAGTRINVPGVIFWAAILGVGYNVMNKGAQK